MATRAFGRRPIADITNHQRNLGPLEKASRPGILIDPPAPVPPPVMTVGSTLRNTRSRLDGLSALDEHRRGSTGGLLAVPQPTVRASPGMDTARAGDPLNVSEHVKSIFERLRVAEQKWHCPGYLGLPGGREGEINARMRAILVDWQAQVHLQFQLQPETLFLCVNILDRFLSLKTVNRDKLQLAGATAVLLAAKYEEVYPPDMKDIARLVSRAYRGPELLTMEKLMLQTLEFNLTVPTANAFLKRLLHVLEADDRTVRMAYYFAETALLHHSMLAYLPSIIASSSIRLARSLLGEMEPWGPVAEYYSAHTSSVLDPCVDALKELLRGSTKEPFQAIRRKYSHRKYGEVTPLADKALGVGSD